MKDGDLAGAIMLSGIYDLAASRVGDPKIAYFGSDPCAMPSDLTAGLAGDKNAADYCGRRTGSAKFRAILALVKTGKYLA